jgi:hypothetical protein
MCFYDNSDVAVVKGVDEDEAMDYFMTHYDDEYLFDSWDHDWFVEEISKEEYYEYDKWEEGYSVISPERESKSSSTTKTSLTEGAYDFEYIANSEHSKAQILNQLEADDRFTKYFKNGQLQITYYRRNPNSYSGYSYDETITDLEITPAGRINITLVTHYRNSSNTRKVDLETVLSKAYRKMDSYDLLKAIKDIATELDRNYRPNVAVRRDRNVFEALVNNPAVAEELKNHIKKIEYRIPLLDTYPETFDIDKAGEPLTDAALKKLEDIYRNFSELPFADDAIDAGIVKNRSTSDDVNRNIEKSWACVGNITFDCAISDLSAEAQTLILTAKVKTEGDAKTDINTTSCYRLANALTRYYDNDIFFYNKKTESLSASLKEHVNKKCSTIESDQELKGTDNAVVDCKVAKIVTHSEDEKPVDCEGKKKPLKKPLTEEVDIIKAAVQCSKNCHDLYQAIVDRVPEKELKAQAKVAYKFIKNKYGLTGKAAEDLIFKGYAIWKLANGRSKYESLTEATAAEFDEIMSLCKEIGIETLRDLDRFTKEEVAKDEKLLDRLRSYRAELGPDFKIIDEELALTNVNNHIKDIATLVHNAVEKYTKECKVGTQSDSAFYVVASKNSSDPKKMKEVIEKALEEAGYTADSIEFKDNDKNYGYVIDKIKSAVSKPMKESLYNFTEEEMAEYNMDEDGVSLDSYDEYVRCNWCGEVFTAFDCEFEADLGWLCDRCYSAIRSRGEKLTIIKNPTDEDIAKTLTEEVEMTKQELKDKFGTDDVDLINAGREEADRVALKEDSSDLADFDYDHLSDDVKKELEKMTKNNAAVTKTTITAADFKKLKNKKN